MTTVWASRHEDLVSPDGVSPHVCNPMVVPHGAVVLERGNSSGSVGGACRDAAAQAQRAERAVDGGGVSVPQALDVSPRALRIHAQRVLDLTTIVPATPCHHRSYVMPYSKFITQTTFQTGSEPSSSR
jgi:hypothetical protein